MNTLPTAISNNPFEVARLALISRLLSLKAPKPYPLFPSPADHETIADHIREAADIFDEWIEAVGFQIADNASGAVDCRSFEDAASAGFDNAIYEATNEAERLRNYRDECRDERRRAF